MAEVEDPEDQKSLGRRCPGEMETQKMGVRDEQQ